jgi:hypothetical protein
VQSSVSIRVEVGSYLIWYLSINDLDELPEQGLFLNDLNHHGLSKEMVLAGWQHNSKQVSN